MNALAALNTSSPASPTALRQKFQEAAGGLVFAEMLKAMRSTVDQPAYLGGGQAEKMFQSQLDQVLAETMAKHHGAAITDPMFQRFEAGLKARSPQSFLATENSTATADLAQNASEVASLETLRSLRQAESATDSVRPAIVAEGLTGLLRR